MNETGEAGSLSRESDLQRVRETEFLALVMPILPKLTRFCHALYRGNSHDNKELAQDLVSETILRAWEHFDRIREPKAFLSYLFTVASRESRYRKKRSKRSQPFSAFDRDFTEVQDDHSSPDAVVDIHYLYAALEKLPTDQRDAIVMSEMVGMKLEEVGEAQGVSLSAVKSRVSRGRKKLAKLLGVKEVSSDMRNASFSNTTSQNVYRFAYQGKEKL